MAEDLLTSACVVVIGGGVIGPSIAFHLAQAGVRDVVLIERDELAAGSTSKAAGSIRAAFSNAANIAIGLRGLEIYARFDEGHGQVIDFHRGGYLYAISDENNLRIFEESTSLQNHYGVRSRMIAPQEAQKISPLLSTEGLLGAAWSPDDAKATPESVVMGYVSSARRLGASSTPPSRTAGPVSTRSRRTATRSSTSSTRWTG